MSLSINVEEFAEAARFVIRVTGKDEIEVLNRGALHAVIGGKGVRGAIQRTPKAGVSQIKSEATKIICIRIIERSLKKQGIIKTRDEINALAVKMVQARLKAIAYTKGPGWNNAAVKFGGRGVKGMDPERFGHSEARHGGGKKASGFSLQAVIENTAPAIEDIGLQPLEDALGDVARDMVGYATKKLQKRFDEVS